MKLLHRPLLNFFFASRGDRPRGIRGDIAIRVEDRFVSRLVQVVWQRPWNQTKENITATTTTHNRLKLRPTTQSDRSTSHPHSCYSAFHLRSIMSSLSIRRLARVVKLTQLQ